jgi:hypothetical protein
MWGTHVSHAIDSLSECAVCAPPPLREGDASMRKVVATVDR